MKLSSLYCGKKINKIWQDNRNYPVINHPQYGMISPNALRAKFANTLCPHCSRVKMFDALNLEAICWKCNQLKSDNNMFCVLKTRINSRNSIKKLLKDSYLP